MARSPSRYVTIRPTMMAIRYCEDVRILICHVISQNHVIKGVCDFMGSYGKLPSCQVWWLWALWSYIYNGFCLSHGLAGPRDQGFICLHGKKRLKVSPYPTKFGDHRHCGSWGIMVLVYYLILKVDVIVKVLLTFWVGAHQAKLPTLVIATLVVEL